jgi:hypothetical protein
MLFRKKLVNGNLASGTQNGRADIVRRIRKERGQLSLRAFQEFALLNPFRCKALKPAWILQVKSPFKSLFTIVVENGREAQGWQNTPPQAALPLRVASREAEQGYSPHGVSCGCNPENDEAPLERKKPPQMKLGCAVPHPFAHFAKGCDSTAIVVTIFGEK